MKREKEELLRKIKLLDNKAELMGLSEEDWGERYKLEGLLEDIFYYEEQIWQQRSSEHWLLKVDSNSGFFHSFANGRRRKCTIWNLESKEGSIHEKDDLRRHIEGYYKKLFGGEERGHIRLSIDLWGE
jgi:hypothetical protein